MSAVTRSRHPNPFVTVGLAAGLFLAHLRAQPVPTAAEPPALRAGISATAEGLVSMAKFPDLTLDAALERLESWSGRTVLRPNALPATSISLTIDRPMSKTEARQVLETVLILNGIAVAPLGEKYLKVVPLNIARTEAPYFIEGSTLDLPPTGQLASKLFQLQFLRVGEFMPQIATLLTPATGSPPLVFEKANAALVTDTISNLQRVEMLAVKLDQPALSSLSPKFFRIQNTTASELVTRLQSILTGPAATQLGTGTSFQADDRTNQIILMSDPRQYVLFDELITKLDTAGESSTRQEVIPLKHANAIEVSTVLSSLISGQSTAARTANQSNQIQTTARNARNQLAARNQQLAGGGQAGGPNQPGGNNPGEGQAAQLQAAQAQAAQAQAQAARAAAASGAPLTVTTGPGGTFVIPGLGGAGLESAPAVTQQFSTILTIVPDERSNSLVVSGTVDDMRLIKELVAQLDMLLAQVRIEVVIAEVTLSDDATSGIGVLGLQIQGDKLVGFSGSGPGINVTNGAITGTSGSYDLAATIALATTPRKSSVRILSVPNIITSHNKEGRIFVGEERPVITSFQNTGANVGNIGTGFASNVNYREIGINLVVTPLIGLDGSVQLEIEQRVEDVLGEVIIDGNAQPRVGKRETASFVSVKSGEILVLGGLQRSSRNKSTSRLGPIPLLGDLFGTRSRTDTRTELVFFLRPYVLTNTGADNAEALRRLENSPQKDNVKAALEGRLSVDKR